MNTSPDSSWFYAEGNDRKGPIPFGELQGLIRQGLPADTLVWTEGMTEWAPASTVPNLVGGSSPSPDSGNPYATPASSPAPPAFQPQGSDSIPAEPIPLDIGFCIGQGWKHTLGNFAPILLFGLCYFAISIGVSFALEMLAQTVDGTQSHRMPGSGQVIVTQNTGPFSILTSIIDWVFNIFLGLGAIRWGFRFLDNENPPISEMFSQGSKLLTGVVATFLYSLAVVLGFVLLIIPGIIVALRLGFFQQAIVEKKLGIIDSLKYSWELTRGNTLSLLGLIILGILICLAGALALLVGLVVAIPTTWLAYLIAFRFLHAGPNGIRVLS